MDPVGEIPHDHGPVRTGGRQSVPVRREGQRLHTTGATQQGSPDEAGTGGVGEISNDHGPVVTAGSQRLPING